MVLVLGIFFGFVHTHIGELGEGFEAWTTISPVFYHFMEITILAHIFFDIHASFDFRIGVWH